MMFHHPNPLRGGCPACGGEQHCPCKNCAKGNLGKVLWRWVDGEIIECGYCGHSGHADQWMDWDMSAWEYSQQSEHHATCFYEESREISKEAWDALKSSPRRDPVTGARVDDPPGPPDPDPMF